MKTPADKAAAALHVWPELNVEAQKSYHDEIINFLLNERDCWPIQYKIGFQVALHAAA